VCAHTHTDANRLLNVNDNADRNLKIIGTCTSNSLQKKERQTERKTERKKERDGGYTERDSKRHGVFI
jgi:hypothetical protein